MVKNKENSAMHELGVLTRALGRIQRLAEEKNIARVKYVTLEVGESSGFMQAYFAKLYPAARDLFPALRLSELRMDSVPGNGLKIKDIAY